MKGFDPRAAMAANAAFRKRNPGGVFHVEQKAVKSSPGAIVGPSSSSLSQRFLSVWMILGGPKLCAEVRISQKRRFIADYFHAPSKTFLEVDGGTFARMGHSTGTGISRDCQKSNLAQLEGYHYFRFTSDMIREPSKFIQPVIDFVKAREKILEDFGI